MGIKWPHFLSKEQTTSHHLWIQSSPCWKDFWCQISGSTEVMIVWFGDGQFWTIQFPINSVSSPVSCVYACVFLFWDGQVIDVIEKRNVGSSSLSTELSAPSCVIPRHQKLLLAPTHSTMMQWLQSPGRIGQERVPYVWNGPSGIRTFWNVTTPGTV